MQKPDRWVLGKRLASSWMQFDAAIRNALVQLLPLRVSTNSETNSLGLIARFNEWPPFNERFSTLATKIGQWRNHFDCRNYWTQTRAPTKGWMPLWMDRNSFQPQSIKWMPTLWPLKTFESKCLFKRTRMVQIAWPERHRKTSKTRPLTAMQSFRVVSGSWTS